MTASALSRIWRADGGRPGDPLVAMVAVMWALASVIHLANQYGARIESPAAWANLIAAVLVLADPWSLRRLTALAAAQVVEVIWAMPFAPDHAMLAGAVDVVILIAVLGHRATHRHLRSRRHLDDAIAGTARVVLLMAYTAAAVAKYNTTFLDPATSCAVHLADAATFGIVGDHLALAPLPIAASLLVESVIPLLLLVPAFRRLGVWVGVIFHFLLSLSPSIQVGDFTATLWPLFLLFLPAADRLAVSTRVGEMLGRSPLARTVRAVDRRVSGVVLLVVAGAVGFLPLVTTGQVRLMVWAAVTVYGYVLLDGLRALSPRGRDVPALWFRPSVPQAVVLLAVAVWALNPYVGFRTTGSFTMFSGLRTEGSGTNHLFMPSVHVVDHQNDLVTISGSDDPALQALADAGQALPYLEVKRAAVGGQIRIHGRRGDEMLSVDADALTRSPVLEKLWHFRAVPADGAPMCTN